MAQQIKVEALPRYSALRNGDTFEGFEIASTTRGSPHMVLNLPEGWTAEEGVRVLKEHGYIVDGRAAHKDYTVLWIPDTIRPYMGEVPGDTFGLMGLTEDVRRRGKFGAGSIVALCDTGLDVNHVAFRGKTVTGDLSDGHGHGTHTASTAASAWGVASDAAIHMVNVLPNGSGTEAGVANGIRAAADFIATQRVPGVLSLSLGGSPSSVIDDAVTYCRQRGTPVVSAAGNDPTASIGSPARASDLIVLACDRARNYASFTSGRTWINPNRCVATGVDIAAAAANTSDGVLVISGTSMATPMIAGMVALWLAANA